FLPVRAEDNSLCRHWILSAVGNTATTTPSDYPPAPVREPPVPMLAQLKRTLPRGGDWRYEPKLDGFRGLLWHGDGATAELLSRNVKDLSAWFPELIVAGQKLPSNTLVDGEIVIADDLGGSDFGA